MKVCFNIKKILRFILILGFVFTFRCFGIYSQVSINTDNSAPDNSAMLDVKATNRGLLIPRIETSARNQIPSPAKGLLIYNTSTNQFNYYNGSFWYQLETTFISSTIGSLSVGGGISITAYPFTALPENSAMLDVNNPTRGILIPRTTQSLITLPATGLIIYDTITNLLSYYNGSQWVSLCAISTGNTGASGNQPSIGFAIKTDNSNPHPSAMLDVSATDKGVLIPRLTNGQRDAILPVTGLVIYNTSTNSIEFYNSTAWYQLTTNLLLSPTAGTQLPSSYQIIWNWNTVSDATGYKWNVTPDYNSATDMGTATTTIETGLNCNTTYTIYIWSYNSCGTSSPTVVTQITNACPVNCQPITDSRDGKIYNTVLIGNQCWMQENLNIGTKINGTQDQTDNGIIEKYCYNNDTNYCNVYGGLYQWNEMMQYITIEGAQCICPTGWHVPSDAEWTQLSAFLGGDTIAGGAMKETGTTHWTSPNTDATNSSGFTALPSGYRYTDGSISGLSIFGFIWSSTTYSTIYAWYRYMATGYPQVYRYYMTKTSGYSARCLKNCGLPPTSGTHVPSQTQIIWNWNTVPGAIGYKWNTTSDYNTAIDMGMATSKTETGITCQTAFTRYVWAYNDCGASPPTTMTQTTSACGIPCAGIPTVIYGGQTYNTVQIGSQCWMKENLNIGTRIDGSVYQTNNSIIEKYCYNNDTNYCNVYGGLYQWNEMMQYITIEGAQGICPTGWHVPSDAEWTTLATFLGGMDVAGGKMKEAATTHWQSPNVGATNSSGFTGLPGGASYIDDYFWSLTNYGFCWSSTQLNAAKAWYWLLYFFDENLHQYAVGKEYLFSARCVKN